MHGQKSLIMGYLGRHRIATEKLEYIQNAGRSSFPPPTKMRNKSSLINIFQSCLRAYKTPHACNTPPDTEKNSY